MLRETAIILLGNFTPAMFFACLIIGYVCFVLRMMYGALHRDVSNTKTPDNFSSWFMIKDNIIRLIFNLMIIPFFIRFATELVQLMGGAFGGVDLSGLPQITIAILCGFGTDMIATKLFGFFMLGTEQKKAQDKINTP